MACQKVCKQGRDDIIVKVNLQSLIPSLVPRPLPDFISQPLRKIGRRPGTNTTSRTGNGTWWTRFGNDGNVPTQYAANTASEAYLHVGILPTATDFASTKSLTKDV